MTAEKNVATLKEKEMEDLGFSKKFHLLEKSIHDLNLRMD